ncbi:unnamed protein product [Durusdinium trenchii]|uniref:Cilia- and flagella-associated protein 157 n=1 Tax=Durusdinium trenchii TaxID=1381693 RepID=A0ABP0RMU5_9DINO
MMASHAQIENAQAATYALIDSQAGLRSQRQQLHDYASGFQTQEDFQRRKKEAALLAIQRAEEQQSSLDYELKEAKDALQKLRDEAAAVEQSRRLCQSHIEELQKQGEKQDGDLQRELGLLHARLKLVAGENALKRTEVKNAEFECYRAKGLAQSAGHALAAAEDERLQAQQEWELRDQVLMKKVHGIIAKLERSVALQHVMERSRKERVQSLLIAFYKVVAEPNPFGVTEEETEPPVQLSWPYRDRFTEQH